MSPSAFDPHEFAYVADELGRGGSPSRTAEQIVDYARTAVGADLGGLTVIRSGGKLATVAPTAQLVTRVDRLQYVLDEGPCRDASWERRTCLVTDLRSERRWPAWSPRVARLGIISILAVELGTTGQRVGSINLYGRQPDQFDHDDVAFAHVFAQHAAVALRTANQVAGLRTALGTRTLIGQAEGILMERYEIDEDSAFSILRRFSQDANIKLRDVAQHVVSTRRLPRTAR